MQYFNITPETTPESLKAQYRELAKTMHPDIGGTKEAFQELHRQYQEALLTLSERPEYGYITESETFRKMMAAADYLLPLFNYPKTTELISKKSGEIIDGLAKYVIGLGLPENIKNLVEELTPIVKMEITERLSTPQQFERDLLELEKLFRNTKNRKKE